MRVLFVGMGSIGKRHWESCRRVRPHFNYAAFRSQKTEDLPLAQFLSLDEVAQFDPHILFICTPTSLHASSLKDCLSVCPGKRTIVLEKPVASSLEDVEAIFDLLKKEELSFHYGCLLRFHPVIRYVKELLVGKKPLSYLLQAESYLPDWRKPRDYRTIYSARKELGGGVSLDLIHEFDFAEYWFGPIEKLQGWKRQLSSLELDVEDLCQAMSFHSSGVSGQISLSYFRKDPIRQFQIVLEDGVIEGSLQDGYVRWGQEKKEFLVSRDTLHDLFSESIFSAAEGKGVSPWSLTSVSELVKKVIAIPREGVFPKERT